MALPDTGPISMLNVIEEIDGTNTTREIALGNSQVRELADIASGTISMDDLHGKSWMVYTDIYMNSGSFSDGVAIDNYIEAKGYSSHMRFGSVSPTWIGEVDADGGHILAFQFVEQAFHAAPTYEYRLDMDRLMTATSITVITLSNGNVVGTLTPSGNDYRYQAPGPQASDPFYIAMRDGGHFRLVLNYD